MSWIVSQIGAREHYAVPRALERASSLDLFLTDHWHTMDSPLSKVPSIGRRIRDRFHEDIALSKIRCPGVAMLAFELFHKVSRTQGWELIMRRNAFYQQRALVIMQSHLRQEPRTKNREPGTFFSYSYAALQVFQWAESRGLTTILGQIDPGPEEERIVQREAERYPHLAPHWSPAPATYWEHWRREIALADHIVVNSEWSKQCLRKEGVPEQKMTIIPLVYENGPSVLGMQAESPTNNQEPITNNSPLRLLFLGQINLRKGIGRLLEAMRQIQTEPIHLDLVGPSQIPIEAWKDLRNVTWHGPVARSRVGDFYQNADLLILPTLSDGFAITQLEALAHGVPLLVSRQCGDVVEEERNGRVLSGLEPATIAEAMRHWLQHPIPKPAPASSKGLHSLQALGEALIALKPSSC